MAATIPTTAEAAVTSVLGEMSAEERPASRLSADWVAVDGGDRPVISVINLDTREQWFLVVFTERPRA